MFLDETVLHQAILLGDVDSVQILLQSATLDLTVSDVNNRNALMVATSTADERMFEILCRSVGVLFTAQNGFERILKPCLYRVSTRDMVNQQQADGSTALMAASKFVHSTGILRRLLDAGADVTLFDKRGRTALHWAAQVGNHEAVLLLVNAKADRDAQDTEDCTPLMHAVREGCEECVLKLLELGCDRAIENREKQTALEMAQHYENKIIVQYIKVSLKNVKAYLSELNSFELFVFSASVAHHGTS